MNGSRDGKHTWKDFLSNNAHFRGPNPHPLGMESREHEATVRNLLYFEGNKVDYCNCEVWLIFEHKRRQTSIFQSLNVLYQTDRERLVYLVSCCKIELNFVFTDCLRSFVTLKVTHPHERNEHEKEWAWEWMSVCCHFLDFTFCLRKRFLFLSFFKSSMSSSDGDVGPDDEDDEN